MADPTPEQEAAFQDWYHNTILAHPERFDPAHFTEGQARNWQHLWDPAAKNGAGGFRSSKTMNGKPIEGSEFDHPDECPPGTAASGPSECRPTGQGNGGGDGGGNGGPGGGPGGGGYGGPNGLDWGTLQGMIGGFNPNLGNDYGISDYWKSIMGGGQAATDALAPQMGKIVGDTEAAKARILRSVPPGGQRDKMLAQLEASKATAGQSARLSLIPQAQAGLQNLYGQQLGARTAQLGQGLGAYTQGKGFETQYGIAQMDDATKRMLGIGGLNLGWGQLGEQGREFDTGLGWDQSRFKQTFGEGQRQFDIGQQDWQKQFDWGKTQGNRNFWGGIASGVGSLFGAGSSSKPWWMSDLRTKENVEKYLPGLSEILKLNPIEYDYNEKAGPANGTHAVSFSAQEVEKILPDAVARAAIGRTKDVRFIDLARIVAASVNAIKELEERTRK